MGKLEIHHEYETGRDDIMGQRVGVLAAVLAVVLAIVTIASHRTHTAAIMHRTTANDAWSYYQAARIKFYVLDVGGNLLAVGSAQGAATDGMRADYEKQKKLYQAEAEQVQSDARKQDALAEIAEARAVRYDVGEGLLEIGLVLTSLYFIARRKMFPAMGVIAGISGSAISITALII